MIWWMNCAFSTIVLVVSVWAVLDPRVKTRLFGTAAFSCIGLFSALHMHKPGLVFTVEVAPAISLSLAFVSYGMLVYYARGSLWERRA